MRKDIENENTAPNFGSRIWSYENHMEICPYQYQRSDGTSIKATSWSPKTIQTLLKRLVTKKAITYEKQSRIFVYSPLVREEEYINQESNTFLKRFYNGDIAAMLSAYIENDKLSPSEIDNLRSLLSNGTGKGGV